MVTIAPGFIQELLERTDIVEVIGQYVPLKKSGANFMGLCPFHGEKSPSFSVSPTKQFFHCFGCGKSGDAIAFLREHNAVDFVEAVSTLATRAGLSVPTERETPAQLRERERQKSQQQAMLEVMDRALRSYRQQLAKSDRAQDYLRMRGVSPEIANHYLLGWSPQGFKHLASVFPDYGSDTLVATGLVIASEGDTPVAATDALAQEIPANARRWDRFRERIMFPIRNVRGQCVGFGGRVLGDGRPKYLNSPETPLFHKGRELYGLFEARAAIRSAGYALVTEGYMDVVALAQLGFGQAVATLGTACTADHVRLLLRFTANIVFCFDGDAAGHKAAERALHTALAFAGDERSFRFAFLPSEHDPDSFIRTEGAAAFEQLIARAQPLGQWLIASAAADCDLSSSEGRAQLSSRARPLWQQLPEGAFKRLILNDLAQKIHLSVDDLLGIWQNSETYERPRFERDYSAQNPRENSRENPQTHARGRDRQNSPQNPRRTATYTPKSPQTPSKANAVLGRGRPRSHPAADQAARILLAHQHFLADLDHDDLDALTHLPSPHGPIFSWIEEQWHENGAQNLALLNQKIKAALIQNPLNYPLKYAADLLEKTIAPVEVVESELRQELRSILTPLLIDRIKSLESELIARYNQDPNARNAYLALQERRKRLRDSFGK